MKHELFNIFIVIEDIKHLLRQYVSIKLTKYDINYASVVNSKKMIAQIGDMLSSLCVHNLFIKIKEECV